MNGTGRRLSLLCLLIILLIFCVLQATCYNILFASIFGSRSHKLALRPIAEELARRGHKVTIMTNEKSTSNWGLKNASDGRIVSEGGGIEDVFLEGAAKAFANKRVNFFVGTIADSHFRRGLFNSICLIANETYADPFVQDLLRIRNPESSGRPDRASRFDVLVVDGIFNDFVLPIGHLLNIPTVYVSPSVVFPHVAWLMNLPSSYSCVPSPFMFAPGQLSLTQKIRSLYVNLRFIYDALYDLYPRVDHIVSEYFAGVPSLVELGRNVSFLLSNDHVSINPKVPTMPYFVQVGGLHLKPAVQLPKDLEDFMNNSGADGVVYFSLGAITKGTSMPNDVRDKLIEGFARLSQKILWKYESPLKELSSNVKIVDWAPQNDLLAHPKMKVFITHGGGLSIMESGYAGCPLLGVPLSADQTSNVANAINAGFAEYINWRDFTVDEFVGKIRKLIDDERYKTNAMRVAALLRDRPEHPTRTAAYWIEYVVRHKGASHLRSEADKLNLLQYFMLDVIGVVLATVFGILAVVVFVAIKTLRILSKRVKCTELKTKMQ